MSKIVSIFCLIFTSILMAGFLNQSLAQDQLNPSQGEPLEITADGTLEWQRLDNKLIAIDNAAARQGEISIFADRLIADYHESESSNIDIWRVTAIGKVIIRSKKSSAYGQKAIYDIDEGTAIMTGNNLRMVSPDQVLTARDRLEYHVASGHLVAVGKAKVKRMQDTLEADKINAVLKENAKGERVLYSLEAIGNVIITTPDEILTGSHGIYKAETNIAELTGGVIIRRGLNMLEGERAEIDLNTNTSRMYGGGSDGNGQVRGIFYPDSEK